MSGLAGIRKRADAYATHGTPGLAAPRDRAELLAILAAIEAVTENAKTVHGRLALRDEVKRILR